MYDHNQTTEALSEYLIKIIDEFNIVLINSHFSGCYQSLLWDKRIHQRVKILFHDHMDFVAEEPVFPQFKKLIKRTLRYRKYGIAVTSVMKRKQRCYLLVPNHWYIPNAITFNRNVNRSLTREAYRKKIGIHENQYFCLFLGWDAYRKGIDIAVKAIKKCRETFPDMILGIVGFGKYPSKQNIEKLTGIIGFSPLTEGVMFLDSEEDMFALHRAADVYISASRKEAFSYGILESISQNVPVVMSNISGTKWAKKYSKCFVYPVENVEKCADAICKAAELRHHSSNNQSIIDKYDIKTWCKKMIDTYDKILQE